MAILPEAGPWGKSSHTASKIEKILWGQLGSTGQLQVGVEVTIFLSFWDFMGFIWDFGDLYGDIMDYMGIYMDIMDIYLEVNHGIIWGYNG